MNVPTIETMASGNPSLTISEATTWESFPDQAAAFVERFGGIVLKRIDTPVERMWIVLIRWRPFFLTFEDLPLRMPLDSMNSSCASVIGDIYAKLLADVPWHKPA